MELFGQTVHKLWPLGLLVLSLGIFQSVMISSCGFEEDFCGWTAAPGADGNWTRRIGQGSYPNAGPLKAFKGNYYICLEPQQFKGADGLVVLRKLVSILSPVLPSVGCVTFVYMKYGNSNGLLRVGLYHGNGSKETVLEIPGQTERTWLRIQNVSFSPGKQNAQVFVEAETGSNILGETALDEVYVYSDPCPPNSTCEVEQDCTSISTSTSASKSASTLSSTMDNTTANVSWSSTAHPDASTSQPEDVFLYVLIVPGVVLIIGVVIAIICFRRRRGKGIRRANHFPTHQAPEEEYDLPNETEMINTRHVAKPTIPHNNNSQEAGAENPYHSIDETSASFHAIKY